MKKQWIILLGGVMSLFSAFSFADNANTPLQTLNLMSEANKQRNYEMLYVLQEEQALGTYRYLNLFDHQKAYGHLRSLDHDKEEMILRDETVSYFGQSFPPFRIQAKQIFDNLPSAFYADFNALKQYHFEESGEDRIADRSSRVIQVIPNDSFRYQFTLWIDKETNVLLKSVLIDPSDQRILEQFSVIELYQDRSLSHLSEKLNQLTLPEPSSMVQADEHSTLPEPKFWIPEGFKLMKKGYQTLKGSSDANVQADSYLYSDGLFSFNIYILPNQGLASEQLLARQGKINIFSQTLGQKDVIIIGDIPAITAKAIVEKMRVQ